MARRHHDSHCSPMLFVLLRPSGSKRAGDAVLFSASVSRSSIAICIAGPLPRNRLDLPCPGMPSSRPSSALTAVQVVRPHLHSEVSSGLRLHRLFAIILLLLLPLHVGIRRRQCPVPGVLVDTGASSAHVDRFCGGKGEYGGDAEENASLRWERHGVWRCRGVSTLEESFEM